MDYETRSLATMLNRSDELELLALIEGELDAAAEAALRRRLVGDPQLLALLDKVRTDRAALRALPEPALPRDFLVSLEPLLARPMLMEQPPAQFKKPGEFRRQYLRQTRRIRWSRLAAVAVVLLAVIAGIWGVVNGLMATGPRGPNEIAAVTPEQAHSNLPRPTQQSPAIEPSIPMGLAHHSRPSRLDVDAQAPASDERALVRNSPSAQADPAGPLVADFAIVIRTASADVTEQVMSAALTETAPESAFVRNFSFAEAQQLAREMRPAARPDSRGEQPTVASADHRLKPAALVSAAQWRALAAQVRQQWEARRTARDTSDDRKSAPESAHLAGSKDAAPSLEQQLEFSSQGATHALAVPASQLSALVERLALTGGQQTALRMLPKEAPAETSATGLDPWQPLSFWLNEGPQVRQAFERVTHGRPDRMVLVPVVVQPAGK